MGALPKPPIGRIPSTLLDDYKDHLYAKLVELCVTYNYKGPVGKIIDMIKSHNPEIMDLANKLIDNLMEVSNEEEREALRKSSE